MSRIQTEPEFAGTEAGGEFRGQVERVAPWLLAIEPLSVAARLTLIAGLLYGAWYAWSLTGYFASVFESFWILGNFRYAVLAFFGWRFWNIARSRFNPGTLHGSAKWADKKKLAADNMIDHRDGILLGRYKDADLGRIEALKRLFTRPLSESDGVVRHFVTCMTGQALNFYRGDDEPLICAPRNRYVSMLTVAPTGAGKGVGVVVPNLLNYKHSVIVLDVKGENFALTAERRKAMGQTVLVLDPFHASGADSATLNPLDLIDNDSPTLIEDLRSLAEAIVIKNAEEKDPHWNEHAVNLIFAVLFLVALEFEGEERSLNEVRRTLSNPSDLRLALEYMQNSDAVEGMLARSGGMFLSMSDKEFSSVQSTANRHTVFLDSPLIAANVAATSFRIRRLSKEKTSLYLILPAQYLQSHNRLMRLWINTLLIAMKQAAVSEQNEVLFLLDEVAQLGEMQPLREALTLLRGWGVRMWFVVQSLNQLEEAYPGPRFKTMLANFGIKQFFGIADLDTAKYVAESIGKTTKVAPSEQRGWNSGNSSGGISSGKSGGHTLAAMERDLIRPEEVMRENGEDAVFILQQGRFPVLARRLTYYADPEFAEHPSQRRRAASLPSQVLGILGLCWFCSLLYEHADFSRFRRQSPPSLATVPIPDPVSGVPVSPGGNARPDSYTPPPVRPSKPQPVDILIKCPKCGNEGEVLASLSGQTIRCQECNTLVEVP